MPTEISPAPCASRRGSALALALILVSSAALMSVLALQKGIQQWKLQASSSAQKQAFYMAEAGISEAIDALRVGSSGNVGTKAKPALFGAGGYWVETLTDESGVAHITSTGLFSGTPYRLCQSVTHPLLPLAFEGFFGSDGVVIGEGSVIGVGEAEVVEIEDVIDDVIDAGDGLIDGGDVIEEPGPWNGNGPGSGNGPGNGNGNNKILLPVAPLQAAEPLRVLGSNGSIDLDVLVSVDGHALPGPDCSVLSALGAIVGGTSVPEMDLRRLPEISMPTIAEPMAPVFDSEGELTVDEGAEGYEAITVADGQILRLVGPLALGVVSLDVQAGGTVVVDTEGGPVHVYIEDSITVESAATIHNTTANPARFVLLVDGRTGDDVDGDGSADSAVQWNSTAAIQACLYAPHATMTLPSGTAWAGGIAVQSLVVGPFSTLLIDERALDVEVRGRDLEAVAWRTIAIPSAERAVLARDPIATALKNGVPLPKASDARIAALATFRFATPEGETLTYSGATLGDLTLKSVDTVLPAKVEPDPAPKFTDYESKQDDNSKFGPAYEAFWNAWSYACGNLGGQWRSKLNSGSIPQAAWDSVVVDGILIEPIASVFGDPTVRDDIDAYLESSESWPPTIEFLRAALDLMP